MTDKTSSSRQLKRQSALNKIAADNGWGSWSRYETTVLNLETEIATSSEQKPNTQINTLKAEIENLKTLIEEKNKRLAFEIDYSQQMGKLVDAYKEKAETYKKEKIYYVECMTANGAESKRLRVELNKLREQIAKKPLD